MMHEKLQFLDLEVAGAEGPSTLGNPDPPWLHISASPRQLCQHVVDAPRPPEALGVHLAANGVPIALLGRAFNRQELDDR